MNDESKAIALFLAGIALFVASATILWILALLWASKG